jgi:hypothetical protein
MVTQIEKAILDWAERPIQDDPCAPVPKPQ